jgi:DNA-directed RNA polymerase I subunit RPA34.5
MHNGVDYGIPVEHQQQLSAPTLLLYNESTRTYQRAPAANIPCYRVQELINLPGRLNGASQESDGHPPASQEYGSPRPQPKHLKMRFRPVGSGDAPPETIGTSSEESDMGDYTFKFPEELKDQENRKRKQPINGQDNRHLNGSPRKKSKKLTPIASIRDVSPPSVPPQPRFRAGQDIQKDRGPRDSSHKSKKTHKHRDETSQGREAHRIAKKKAAKCL